VEDTCDRPTTELCLLDGFELRVDGTSTRAIPSVRRLLAFLAVRDHTTTRAVVATELWPDASRTRAAACLRSTLWRVVQPGDLVRLVRLDGDALGIAPDVRVDLAQARALATRIVRRGEADVPDDQLQRLTTDVLPGWSDPWVVAERDWFRQLRLRALEALSERFRLDGDLFRAYETAVAAVQADPLRESAHRKLIELHLADGNPAEAVRQYTTYRARLRSELGLTPSPEIDKLLRPISYQRKAPA
jgi:DNA-binding SARP family transcriptional activator